MNKIALPLLLVLLACGCISPETGECKTASDCEGKPHVMCVGAWQCMEGECAFQCDATTDTTQTTGTLQATDTTQVTGTTQATQVTDTTETTVALSTSSTQTTLPPARLSLDSFSQSPCPKDYLQNRYENQVQVRKDVSQRKKYLIVNHLMDYVCCANITLSMNATVEDSYYVVNIYEKNIGEKCRCICGYNITAVISGVSERSDYMVRVYGIEYASDEVTLIKEVSTNPLVAGEGGLCLGLAGITCRKGLSCELEVDYPDAAGVCVRPSAGAECSKDSDCAAGGCSGQICTTKENAESIVTTCEMLPTYECLKLTSCGCVNGTCEWKDNPAFDSCIKIKSST